MANSDAKHLYDDLLRKSGYNKLIRPVMNNSDKLIVKLGLRLSQLIDVVRIISLLDILRIGGYFGGGDAWERRSHCFFSMQHHSSQGKTPPL